MIRTDCSAVRVAQAFLALSSFVLAVTAGAATVYKWTDERGEVHYSDKKPAGRKWEIVNDGNISVIPSVVPNASSPPTASTNETAKNDDDRLAFERALAERRQRLLEKCEQDRGVDCATQVDTELEAERIQATGSVIHLAPPRAAASPR